VLTLQGEVAGAIANAINIKMGMQQELLKTTHSTSQEAQDAYLRGRYWWHKRTEEGEFKGLEFFQQAINLDKQYAAAYAGMADSYLVLAHHGRLPPLEAMPKAKTAAMAAIRLDDSLAEGHNSLALIDTSFDWNYPAAEVEFNKAILLNPNYAPAHHWFAHYLAVIGRDADALKEIERARLLDPFSISINSFLVLTLYYDRQYDRALDTAMQMSATDSTFAMAAERLEGDIYAAKGQYADAVVHWNKSLVLSGEAAQAINLQQAYTVGGYRAYLNKELQQINKSSPGEHLDPLGVAQLYTRLGDKDAAFEWLERAYNQRSSWLNFIRADPVYDPLHSDRRFTEMLRRIGLPTS
jgi:tetratricopeptide (TPR) repeat protein